MATPLTDKINALTSAANETTGASDTTLGDAVATLIAGYGGGGGYTADEIATMSQPSGEIDLTIETIPNNGLRYRENITGINAPNLLQVGMYGLADCSDLVSFTAPNLKRIQNNGFQACKLLKSASFPELTYFWQYSFDYCQALQFLDLGLVTNYAGNGTSRCPVLTEIVLRSDSVVELTNIQAFNGTPFASGGTGGTIYVPESLIESYQTANNWSTLYGYGTVTFSSLEDSAYA